MMFLYRCILASAVVAFVSSVEILLDDAGQHIRPGAAWTKAEGNCAQAGHGGGFHHNNGVHNDESFATWNFSVAKDGCYWVEEFHPNTSGCGFSLSSRVPVHIHFCKGLRTAGLIDQTQRGGQWNRLVKLPFYTTHTAAIHISAMGLNFEAAGVWAADAFRLTWDSKSCHDKEVESDEAVAPTEEEAEAESTVPAAEEVTKEEKTKVALKEEANLPLLQALVDDADTKVLGSTLEPISQCPGTASRTFHHDALRKDRRARATFHFNPPRDGCYLIEELHPRLEQCKASSNTKVHINYCKGLKAVGTVDQTINAGQWSFLAALPFFAGHPGNVTLSNEGTEPDTLAVFDQVRFTWSGKSCGKVDSHPRQAEIRMTVDFKNVANRRAEFGSALRTKLAVLANVPEKALRLTGLRSGSIIAEFLVLPSVVDDPLSAGLSAGQTIEKLRVVVKKYTPDLCALTGASLEGCEVEFKDLGVAMPSIRPVPEQRPQLQVGEGEPKKEKGTSFAMIISLVATAIGLVSIVMGCWLGMVRRAKKKAPEAMNQVTVDATKAAANEGTASTEEGKAVEEKKPEEDELDNSSTLAPSSDKQSEPSLNGDIEGTSNPDLAVIKALSEQNI